MSLAERFDAVVIGAGPAGSAVAITLAGAGRRVALIERAAFPRHKVCGEFLSPACRTLLSGLGVWEDVQRCGPPEIPELVLASRRRALRADFPACAHGMPFGISRFALDALLLRRAAQVGATIFSPALAKSIDAPRRPSAPAEFGRISDDVSTAARGELERVVAIVRDGHTCSILGRHVVVADGLARGLALADRERSDSALQIGVKTHVSGVDFARNAIEVHALDRAYVGMSPVEGGRVTVCAAVDAREFRRHGNSAERWFEAACRQNRRFGQRVSRATPLMPWLVSPLPRYRFRPVRTDILAVGAAATAIDPIIGEGMRTAMESGVRLAETLLTMPDAPPSRVLREMRRTMNSGVRLRDRVARSVFMLSRHETIAGLVLGGLSLARPVLNMIVRASGK